MSGQPAPATCWVVVVAYRSSAHVRACLEPLLLDPAVGGIVVVDNSSDIETARIVANLGLATGRLRYVDPGGNLGFARGCNLGADLADGHAYLAFVNPDVTPRRGIRDVVDLLHEHRAVIAAARLSPSHRASPDANARQLATGWSEFRKAVLGTRALAPPVLANGVFPVGQVDGAFMVLRTVDFHRLGGFDARFELYYEDVDLCRRAASLGGCVFDTRLWGYHVGGASFRTASEVSYCLLRVSRVRYLRKHRLGVVPPLAAMVIAIAEFAARSLTRRPEKTTARARALRLQLQEALRPGSVTLLARPPQIVRTGSDAGWDAATA